MSRDTAKINTVFREYLNQVYLARKIYSDLIPLSIGFPVGNILNLPNEILEALSPAQGELEKERIGYGWTFSTGNLKEKIVAYENTKNNTNYLPQNICLTAGASHGINTVFNILIRDYALKELFILAPAFYKLFGNVENIIKIKNIIGQPQNNFWPSFKQIIQQVKANDSVKALFLSNPSNPTYKFLPSELLQKIIDYTYKKNVYLIIDEVGDAFRYINYIYPKNIMYPNVIRINSASKLFLMPEYSIGYILTSSPILKSVSKYIGHELGHIPFAGCNGWLVGIVNETKRIKSNITTNYAKIYQSNLDYLTECKELVIKTLGKSDKIKKIIEPDASFSMLFQVKKNKYKFDRQFFKILLEEKHVSIVPGSAFGIEESKMFFRLTFAIEKNILAQGVQRILEFIEIT